MDLTATGQNRIVQVRREEQVQTLLSR
jgi:hypothetical protein